MRAGTVVLAAATWAVVAGARDATAHHAPSPELPAAPGAPPLLAAHAPPSDAAAAGLRLLEAADRAVETASAARTAASPARQAAAARLDGLPRHFARHADRRRSI